MQTGNPTAHFRLISGTLRYCSRRRTACLGCQVRQCMPAGEGIRTATWPTLSVRRSNDGVCVSEVRARGSDTGLGCDDRWHPRARTGVGLRSLLRRRVLHLPFDQRNSREEWDPDRGGQSSDARDTEMIHAITTRRLAGAPGADLVVEQREP